MLLRDTVVDLVSTFCPWAEESMRSCAAGVMIGCIITKGVCDIAAGEQINCVNHWVIGEPIDSDDDNPGRPSSAVADDYLDETTATPAFLTMCRFKKLRPRKTVANGNCGFDGLLAITGTERTVATRRALRLQLANFCYENMFNRALIDILSVTGEVKASIVSHAVESAGLEMLGRYDDEFGLEEG